MTESQLELVRNTTSWIMTRAKHVSIDESALEAFAAELCPKSKFTPPTWRSNPDHFFSAEEPDLVVQYILVMDVLNFCFWPTEGLEYDALAGGLKRALLADPHVFDAERLASATEDDVKRWVRSDILEAAERARLVRECGAALLASFGGLAANLVRSAGKSAARLVGLVTQHIPGFRDSSVYAGRQVFFNKRSQIFVGDVWGAFEGEGLGEFCDVGRLTMFPDYRVPQVLHAKGVMKYEKTLDEWVRAKKEVIAGSQEECEIRAASVQAVERLCAVMGRMTGQMVTPVQLDWLLWNTGEENLASLPPHHRTRTIFY